MRAVDLAQELVGLQGNLQGLYGWARQFRKHAELLPFPEQARQQLATSLELNAFGVWRCEQFLSCFPPANDDRHDNPRSEA